VSEWTREEVLANTAAVAESGKRGSRKYQSQVAQLCSGDEKYIHVQIVRTRDAVSNKGMGGPLLIKSWRREEATYCIGPIPKYWVQARSKDLCPSVGEGSTHNDMNYIQGRGENTKGERLRVTPRKPGSTERTDSWALRYKGKA